MLNSRTSIAIAALLFAVTGARSQQFGEADPLFQDDRIVEITITAPYRTLLKTRPNQEYLPGRMSYTEADGSVADLEIGIRTRGKFRREKANCQFPPLRVNIRTSQPGGTLFHKQDKLKLVTHCRDNSDRYEQNVIREYLAYRILNTLSDVSYRVRLLRVTYIDSEQRQKDRLRYAFFIEHKNRVSKRTGLPLISSGNIKTNRLEGAHSDLTSLFQFLIGNTDFSPVAGPEGEECCHNSTLFGDEGGPIYSIPYDFDMSGIVDAPYAAPNPRFKITRVTQRVYRGRCLHIGHLDASVQAFMDNRAAIYALLDDTQELRASTHKALTRFIDQFYKVISDPKQRERQLVKKCV